MTSKANEDMGKTVIEPHRNYIL